MLSLDPTDKTTEGHVDGGSEERGAKQDEYIRDDVWSHGGGIVMGHTTADVADDLN